MKWLCWVVAVLEFKMATLLSSALVIGRMYLLRELRKTPRLWLHFFAVFRHTLCEVNVGVCFQMMPVLRVLLREL
jgi:hypothetical protein